MDGKDELAALQKYHEREIEGIMKIQRDTVAALSQRRRGEEEGGTMKQSVVSVSSKQSFQPLSHSSHTQREQ